MAQNNKLPLDQRGVVGFLGGLISLVFSIVIGILAFRFIFRLIGANESNALVQWIYNASAPLVSPFYGIFGRDITLSTGRFELETLLALIVYGIVASLVVGLFSRGYGRTHPV